MTTPVIIEAAINGATTRPRTERPDDRGRDRGRRAAVIDAGAAIVHAHCDPVSGPDDEVAERYLARSGWCGRSDRTRSLYPTANFSAGGISFGHLGPLAEAGLRIGLLDPGSVNFGRMGDDGLPTGSFVYQNSFDRIKEVFAYHDELGLGPSLAIYEPGFLYTTLLYQRRGKLPRGAMVKFYLSTERGLERRAVRAATDRRRARRLPRPPGRHADPVGGVGRRWRPRPLRHRAHRAGARRPPPPRAGVLRWRPAADERRARRGSRRAGGGGRSSTGVVHRSGAHTRPSPVAPTSRTEQEVPRWRWGARSRTCARNCSPRPTR